MNKGIAICLPSRNESDNIAHVTTIIDRALQLFSPNTSNFIINVDSYSTDGTKEFFLKTQTESQKISFSQIGGKGANIIKFMDYAQELDASYFGMFDADLTSIESDWIVKMLTCLKMGADYVVPSYQRSPFEGSTTNHLCAPIIQCLFQKSIEQPIGGDFMFNRRFVSEANKRLKKSNVSSNLRYGIDIFLTTSALLEHLNICNCSLTKKLHKPSFPKIESMFVEVTTSFFDIIRNNNIPIRYPAQPIPVQHFITDTVFIHKEQALLLRKNNLNLIKNDWKYYCKILDIKTIDMLSLSLKTGIFNENLWAMILFDYLKLLKTTEPIEKLAYSLKNLFICRAVTFWEQAEKYPVLNSAEMLQQQTVLLQKLLEGKNVLI